MLEDARPDSIAADALLLGWATLYLLSALQRPLVSYVEHPISLAIGVVLAAAFGVGLATAAVRDLDARWYAALGALEATNVVALLDGGELHVGWFVSAVDGSLVPLVALGSLTVVVVLYVRALRDWRDVPTASTADEGPTRARDPDAG